MDTSIAFLALQNTQIVYMCKFAGANFSAHPELHFPIILNGFPLKNLPINFSYNKVSNKK